MGVSEAVIKFAQAAGKLGVTSVTGAVLLLGVGLYEHIAKHNVSTSVFVIVAFVLFAYGCLLAWKTEHDARARESSRPVKPDFEITASNVIAGLLDSKNVVLVKVSVVNRADVPSTIRAYYIRQSISSQLVMATNFDKATLPTNSTQHSIVMSEDGVSFGNTRVLVELRGLLSEEKHTVWPRFSHRDGWLCFQLREPLQEADTDTSLWFQIEDAAGDMHYSKEQVCKVEWKAIFW